MGKGYCEGKERWFGGEKDKKGRVQEEGKEMVRKERGKERNRKEEMERYGGEGGKEDT